MESSLSMTDLSVMDMSSVRMVQMREKIVEFAPKKVHNWVEVAQITWCITF